ncbi:MAG: VWA domain-containing protein [Acidimicrobiia bacterium]|nr:VWA domain-containing protein [Acidimicrobiia bacterium]
MSYLSPERLWLLVLVAVLAVAYVLIQRRRKVYSLRFASPELFDSIAPEGPGFRRHVPPIVFLAALAVLVAAFAQPARQVRVPRERATVIVAIDVSLSMQATDVEPNRLSAAQVAANRFIDELPPSLNVGIVSFAGTASVLVSPTIDRLPAHNAINNLRLAESTAIGEAIFTSIDALQTVPADGAPEPPPARIVLLSDGQTTVGRPDSEAVNAAVEADVPVSTIAFGTTRGTIEYDDPNTAMVERQEIPVPVMEDNLRAIADGTNGAFFTASSLDELEAVYNDIGSAIGYELVDREITDWFVGGGIALLALAAAFSLVWFQRLP